VDVLAEDDDARIFLHAAVHDIRHDVYELRVVVYRALECLQFRGADTVKLGQIAAHAMVAKILPGPERGTNPALAAIVLHQFACDFIHQRLGALPQRLHRLAADELALLHFHGQAVERVARAPFRFLCLVAIAEGAAGEGAVLMEEAVNIGFNDGRAAAAAHHLHRFLGGQIDGKRIHAVHFP
jgi:hypothetical protein